MAKNNNLQDFLKDLANTIRAKKGVSYNINPQDFSSEINSISTSNNQSKTVSINSNGTTNISPDSGYTGLSDVSVSVNVPNSTQGKTLNISSNGTTTYYPQTGFIGFDRVTITVNVPSDNTFNADIELIDDSIFGLGTVSRANYSSINIREGVTTLSESALEEIKTTTLTLPQSLRTIENKAFYGFFCSNQIVIPSGVSSFGIDCFNKKTDNLGHLELTIDCNIPNSAEEAYGAFYNASGTFTLGENNFRIGNYSMCSCSKIVGEFSSTTEFGNYCFKGSTIRTVVVSDTNKENVIRFKSTSGIIKIKKGSFCKAEVFVQTEDASSSTVFSLDFSSCTYYMPTLEDPYEFNYFSNTDTPTESWKRLQYIYVPSGKLTEWKNSDWGTYYGDKLRVLNDDNTTDDDTTTTTSTSSPDGETTTKRP